MSSSSVTVKFDLLPAIAAQLEHKAGAAVARPRTTLRRAPSSSRRWTPATLRNSITAEQQGALAWIVAVGAEYGIYQEYGTHKMGARARTSRRRSWPWRRRSSRRSGASSG
jgi:hypothetical protein